MLSDAKTRIKELVPNPPVLLFKEQVNQYDNDPFPRVYTHLEDDEYFMRLKKRGWRRFVCWMRWTRKVLEDTSKITS